MQQKGCSENPKDKKEHVRDKKKKKDKQQATAVWSMSSKWTLQLCVSDTTSMEMLFKMERNQFLDMITWHGELAFWRSSEELGLFGNFNKRVLDETIMKLVEKQPRVCKVSSGILEIISSSSSSLVSAVSWLRSWCVRSLAGIHPEWDASPSRATHAYRIAHTFTLRVGLSWQSTCWHVLGGTKPKQTQGVHQSQSQEH